MSQHYPSRILVERRERLLLILAATFVSLYACALTLSPVVRARDMDAGFRWEHWLGAAAWMIVFALNHLEYSRRLPARDPYLLPIAGLLSGWGLMTIWRLYPYFGYRQTIWTVIAGGILYLGARLPNELEFLRRYKYLWLSGGLLFTGLTLFFGSNPLGYGPRMWLGCCGIYFQPSEPLKLLLIVYLSAYLAGLYPFAFRREDRNSEVRVGENNLAPLLPLLAPTLMLTGLALVILVAQRDLGTASIFLFLYTAIVYVASGRYQVLTSGIAGLLAAAGLGYILFDVVRLRVDAWVNPWTDPTGRSFQIVQSLLAVANGGLVGRGPGVGNPTLVPIPHSDFIFAAIAEENGLLGALGLLGLVAIFSARGLRAAFHAQDMYRRYLAAGLVAYIAAQSVLIIGGNLRLLPLTGVTLPFVSYGGSSLVTSFVSLLLLLHIGSTSDEYRPLPLINRQPYIQLGIFLFTGIVTAGLVAGWWSYYRSPDLLTRTDNARRAIAERYVRRGSILDRANTPLAQTMGEPGAYTRWIEYPALSGVIGYSHPVYGQTGLEAGVDGYLRGTQGIAGLTVWWHHLLYGQPPPGLDVRTTLDLTLQEILDEAVSVTPSAAVLLDANTGEILAMTSHPGFDANILDETWDQLVSDPSAPLLNRAIQGSYPAGPVLESLFEESEEAAPFGSDPYLRIPAAESGLAARAQGYLSPIQAALAAAPISNEGLRPGALIVQAVNTPAAGWVLLPALSEAAEVYTPAIALEKADQWASSNGNTWEYTSTQPNPPDQAVSWYVGGTHPESTGEAVVLALVIESEDAALARQTGQAILQAAIFP